MSFQEMYGLRGPWGRMAVLQLTNELRPKWKNNNNKNKNKTQNAVSRSDPLQGSDKDHEVGKTSTNTTTIIISKDDKET